MWIGVLGPLQVLSGGEPVEIGGLRLRALLARLAVDAGRAVSVESLTEVVWPESTPENPAHALQSLIARLRRALPDRSALRSVSMGYLLELGPAQVDVLRFEELIAEGRRALRDRGPAAELLGAALELWRGDPFSDVPAAPYAAAESVRLGELRLSAVEARIDAELTSGAHRPEVVAELEVLIAAHPLRERLRVLLLTELDRQGRQAEALAAYEAYRALLADELGSDPGAELRELHLGLLRGELPRRAFPAELTSFVGRDEECSAVAEHLRQDRLVTLVGPGAVGKTRLATAVAARLPGSAWLVELDQAADPADVPHAIAAALGVRGTGDIVSRLVEAVAGTESVLVLDNCEHVIDSAAEVAHELLRRCPRLRVLATSREPLGITGEVRFPVHPLDQAAAVRLFTDRARAASPGFAATGEVAEICGQLDGLPLAIELAAARLRTMSFAHLVARLADRFRLLTGGSRTALPRHRTLRAVVAWSWELLTDVERDALERLSVFSGGFAPDGAERAGIVRETVDSLVDKSLLQLSGERYRMLDTIREYGIERLRETGQLDSARERHVACFLALAEQAEPHLREPGRCAGWNGSPPTATTSPRRSASLPAAAPPGSVRCSGTSGSSAVITSKPCSG
ncbi:Predicted ATPase [Saccharopolyspora antimicrobica]|uniref:Predicted ATPase n=1 Tax=Saccharopolyspora antimicrobica TaxID=455193 RepID=A0A1I5GZY9_9PSEU|nr:BTAD domain-containing putative transcriptional regulator [Saccharopolyspora antimicrobica]SFO41525.1 Predicted ATPase [Saccharopolyspora antimicrobica]